MKFLSEIWKLKCQFNYETLLWAAVENKSINCFKEFDKSMEKNFIDGLVIQMVVFNETLAQEASKLKEIKGYWDLTLAIQIFLKCIFPNHLLREMECFGVTQHGLLYVLCRNVGSFMHTFKTCLTQPFSSLA